MTVLVSFSAFAQAPAEDKKNLAAARQQYLSQKALLSPDDLDDRLELGVFCSENGLFREAVEEFRKVMAHPNLSLKSKQNVARLIETTEENAAITLYNAAMRAWQRDKNFAAARVRFEELFAGYPSARVAAQARKMASEMVEEEKIKGELAAAAQKLRRVVTENFIVYAPDDKLSAALAGRAERCRREAIERFGFSIFPPWKKNPARLYVFASRDEFLRHAGSHEWSGGWTQQVLGEEADGTKEVVERSVFTYAGVAGLQESVVPHEVTHLVFREFFGFSENLPPWLDEGVAVWNEETKHTAEVRIEKPIPFRQFLFLKNYPPEPALFYAQSASVVEFLVSRHGPEKFVAFVKVLAVGRPLEEALQSAFSDEYLDLDDFEQAWQKSAAFRE